ncbi:unnamed protein product [Ambrosiozyma monospora]|uniref:Unnamed protein product n=1 Tax=Ambrosiozyma monospora TaxID=43982 RepID=A0ACB5T1R7_AMBMO|nr:unnamed protein product [Ambrosiozyma monospora]
MTVSANDWKFGFNAGGKILPEGELISPDGKFSLVLFKSQIRVFSLSTRQSVRSIKVNDLTDVVDTAFSKLNSSAIHLFTKTNKIITINWKDRVANPIIKEKTFKFSTTPFGSILKFLKMDATEESFYLLTGKQTSNAQKIYTRYIVKTGTGQDVVELGNVKNAILFNHSINRNRIVFFTTKNTLHYAEFINNDEEIKLHTVNFQFKTQVTSLAITSGDDAIIAAGTSSGIIQIVYVHDQTRPQRLLKWHIDQVKALSFNHDDNYLLSGGLEKVLCFWNLESDKQQFLPRLSGTIEKIILQEGNEDLYGIYTKLNDDSDFEYIVLNAVDLVSRLNVNGVRAKFASSVEWIAKDKKRLRKQQFNLDNDNNTKVKHDFTADFLVHDISKLVYVPSGSYLQAYDVAKNEQSFVTAIAPTIQAGKVRSETLIQDPTIEHFAFSSDGKWMCTFDSLSTPELDDLMSAKYVKYSLKFWMFVDNLNGKSLESGHWELTTKIIDPHGLGVPICEIHPSPVSYHEGHAFVTADIKGNLRLWKPKFPKKVFRDLGHATSNKKLQQTAWTLRKIRRGTGKLETGAVSISWSPDSSLIALAQDTSIFLVDADTFEDIEDITLPSLAGSRIRSLSIVDNNLIIVAKNRIVSFNLLTFASNELSVKVNTPIGAKHLISVDHERNLICLGVNYYTSTYDTASRIYVLSPEKLKPVFCVAGYFF